MPLREHEAATPAPALRPAVTPGGRATPRRAASEDGPCVPRDPRRRLRTPSAGAFRPVQGDRRAARAGSTGTAACTRASEPHTEAKDRPSHALVSTHRRQSSEKRSESPSTTHGRPPAGERARAPAGRKRSCLVRSVRRDPRRLPQDTHRLPQDPRRTPQAPAGPAKAPAECARIRAQGPKETLGFTLHVRGLFKS